MFAGFYISFSMWIGEGTVKFEMREGNICIVIATARGYCRVDYNIWF